MSKLHAAAQALVDDFDNYRYNGAHIAQLRDALAEPEWTEETLAEAIRRACAAEPIFDTGIPWRAFSTIAARVALGGPGRKA